MKRVSTLFLLFLGVFAAQSVMAQSEDFWHGWGEDLEGMEATQAIPSHIDQYTLIGMDNQVAPSAATGFDDINELETVTVYPNPVEDKLIIDIGYTSGLLGDAEVMIFSMTGQEVLEATFKPGQQMATMNVEKLPVGVYMVRILLEGDQQVRKIVKQK